MAVSSPSMICMASERIELIYLDDAAAAAVTVAVAGTEREHVLNHVS